MGQLLRRHPQLVRSTAGRLLFGRRPLLGGDGARAHFASDLPESVAFGDARYAETRNNIAKTCLARGIPVPDMPNPPPFRLRPRPKPRPCRPWRGDLHRGVSTRLHDMGSLRRLREVGFPLHHEGASTAVPGLYFCGVHFLRKRKSSLLSVSDRTPPSSPRQSPTPPRPRGTWDRLCSRWTGSPYRAPTRSETFGARRVPLQAAFAGVGD